jgi:hypothetical protein
MFSAVQLIDSSISTVLSERRQIELDDKWTRQNTHAQWPIMSSFYSSWEQDGDMISVGGFGRPISCLIKRNVLISEEV